MFGFRLDFIGGPANRAAEGYTYLARRLHDLIAETESNYRTI